MTDRKITVDCIDPHQGALLLSYELGLLDSASAQEFEEHLLHCKACLEELRMAKELIMNTMQKK